MNGYLTREQIEQILRPINETRVSSRDGLAYVEAYEVRAHMARIYGVARWSSEVVEQHLICEDAVQTKAGKPAWYVVYRSVVRVTVCAPDGTQLAVYTEGHAGDSTHPVKGDAHGNAITNSESYAFKRAACMALLDQGGLSLYGKGSKAALVKRTLVMPDADAATSDAAVDHDAEPVVPEADTDVRQPSPSAALPESSSDQVSGGADSGPAASDSPSGLSPEDVVTALRDRAIAAVAMKKREGIQQLARISAEAAKARVMQAPTTRPDGTTTTLNVLLDEAMRRLNNTAEPVPA